MTRYELRRTNGAPAKPFGLPNLTIEPLTPFRSLDGVFTICSHGQMEQFEDDLPFRVEQWDRAGKALEQTLSASADLRLGRAAFTEAVRQRPGQRIMLRHKTRVIEEHRKMSANRIDKLEIARRELDFAILTYKRGEESLAVHLLAFSAFRILFDLTKRQYGDGALVFMLDRFLDRREKLGAEFHDLPNSMKHADKDPDGWLEDHTPKTAHLTLAVTIILWAALGETETDMMAEFWRLDNPLLPGFKARSGLEAIKARAGEVDVQPGPRTFAEVEQIINRPST